MNNNIRIKFFISKNKYVNSHRYRIKKFTNGDYEYYKSLLYLMTDSYGTYSKKTKIIRVNLHDIYIDFEDYIYKIYEVITHETLHSLVNDEIKDCINAHTIIYRVTDFLFPGILSDLTKKWFLIE